MKKEVIILGAIIVAVVIAVVLGSNYYRNSVQNERLSTRTPAGSNQGSVNPEILVRPDSYFLGSTDARVTLVEFLDPECEGCAAFHPIVKKLLKDYEGRIRLVVRYMPLHPNSLSAAAFTEAAGEQGKYWQAQELLFQRQNEWGQKHGPAAASQPPPNINQLFQKYAEELGLDLAKANAAVQGNRYLAKIDRDKKDGETLGVRQTPTFFVNGRQLARLSEADLRALIDAEMQN